MIRGSETMTYLSQAGVVELTTTTALVGHDGWADARLGDYDGSKVIFNDFLLIEELRHWRDEDTLDKPALRQTLQALGDEAAAYLEGVLLAAAAQSPASSWPRMCRPSVKQPGIKGGHQVMTTCRSYLARRSAKCCWT